MTTRGSHFPDHPTELCTRTRERSPRTRRRWFSPPRQTRVWCCSSRSGHPSHTTRNTHHQSGLARVVSIHCLFLRTPEPRRRSHPLPSARRRLKVFHHSTSLLFFQTPQPQTGRPLLAPSLCCCTRTRVFVRHTARRPYRLRLTRQSQYETRPKISLRRQRFLPPRRRLVTRHRR